VAARRRATAYAIEAVFIPEQPGHLCISTQAADTSPASSARPAGRDSTAIISVSEIIGQLWLQPELGATPGGERVISKRV